MAILFAEDFPSESTRLRRVTDGTIQVIARGIWTEQTGVDVEEVVAEHCRTIVAHVLPGAVITGRTAFEHAPENGALFVAHTRWRPFELPGLTIYPDGRGERRDDDVELASALYGASLARAILDNAETRGRPSDPPRRLTPDELRDRLRGILAGLDTTVRGRLLAELDEDENSVAADTVRALVGRAQEVPLFDLGRCACGRHGSRNTRRLVVVTGAPMTKSGFCQWPSPGSHQWCQQRGLRCDCPCHTDPAAYDDGHTIGDAPGDAASDLDGDVT